MSSKSSLRETGLRTCLADLGLPSALLSGVSESCQSCDSRIAVIDNSAFMRIRDSHVGCGGIGGSIERLDNVTRWGELEEALAFDCRVAFNCWMPTKYCLLNEQDGLIAPDHGTKLPLCWSSPEDVPRELMDIKHVIKNVNLDRPKCELTPFIKHITDSLKEGESHLLACRKKITVILYTQGMPTNSKGQSGSTIRQEFREALRALTKLPVKVLVRLCTDDEKATNMFNEMDDRFDSIDVLDDYWGEAMEVYLHNPWLTYSYGLHRLRETGLAPDVFGELDQRPLTLDEIHQLCHLLFVGEDTSVDLPLPPYQPTSSHQLKRPSWINNWEPFISSIGTLLQKEKLQWNPIKKRMTPWINLKQFESTLKGQFGQSSSHTNWNGTSGHPFRGSDPAGDFPSRSQSDPGHPYHSGDSAGGRDSRGQSRRHTNGSSFKRPKPKRWSSSRAPGTGDLTLEEIIKRWSHKSPDCKKAHSLQRLLITAPWIFPPMNDAVEDHEYFDKWHRFDKEAFADMSGNEMKPLLQRALRKAKFFLHPDKLPKDLTENQKLLLSTMWDVISQRGAAISHR